MINWLLGYLVFALFISILDRYFSGEDYKKSQWINGKSIKFKLALSIVISIAPYFFMGVSSDTLYVPFRVAGMLIGFYLGEFFLKSYDWAFKKPSDKIVEQPPTLADKIVAAVDGIVSDEGKKDEAGPKTIVEDDKTRQSVVEAIQGAGTNLKQGLKSVGDGIAKASENLFKKDEEKDKKDYESNKKLDDKLKDY